MDDTVMDGFVNSSSESTTNASLNPQENTATVELVRAFCKGFHAYIIYPQIEVAYPPKTIETGSVQVLDFGGVLRVSGFNDFLNVNQSNRSMLEAMKFVVDALHEQHAEKVAFRGFEPAQRYAKVLCKGLNIDVVNFKDEELYQHLIKRVEQVTHSYLVEKNKLKQDLS